MARKQETVITIRKDPKQKDSLTLVFSDGISEHTEVLPIQLARMLRTGLEAVLAGRRREFVAQEGRTGFYVDPIQAQGHPDVPNMDMCD